MWFTRNLEIYNLLLKYKIKMVCLREEYTFTRVYYYYGF